tara:strand:+ start:8100 stop:10607 length:2508 start_codon:yes stop_codon:yes gene_type:complete
MKDNKTSFLVALTLLNFILLFPIIQPVLAEPISRTDYNTNSQNYTPESKIVLVNSTEYIFYEASSGNHIIYTHKIETDKEWSSGTYLAGNVDASKFAVKSDDTNIHVAYVDNDDGVRYLQLTPAADESLTVAVNTTLLNQPSQALSIDVGYNSTRYPIVVVGDNAATDHLRIWYASAVDGSAFQAPITSWTFPTQQPTAPSTCNAGAGITVFLAGDTGTNLKGRLWYQTNQSFGNEFTISTSMPTQYDYDITCTNNAVHVYFEESNASYYQNITNAGMQSSNIQVDSGTVDGLAISTDNSSTLLFATSKSMEVLLSNFTIGGTLQSNGIFNINASSTITNLHMPEFTTNGVSFLTYTYDGKLGYSIYGGTNTVTFHFYDSDTRGLTPQNMSLLRLSDNTLIEISTISGNSTTKDLTSGYYNVSSIYRNDLDLKQNQTQIFITPAFTVHSLIVHNVSITFNFYDEVTLEPYTLPKFLSFYYGNTQRGNYSVGTESSITLGLPEIPSKVSTNFGPSEEFFRWNRINATQFNQTFSIYLPDYNAYTVQVYTFDLRTDPLNLYSEGYFKVQLPTPSGLITISYMDREPDGTLEVPLIKNHLYRLTAYNKDLTLTTEVGDYIAGNELTMQILLGSVSFSTNMELAQKFLSWSAKRTTDTATCPLLNCNIRVMYLDRTDSTTSLTIRILNSSGLQYSTTVVANEYTLNWAQASTNSSYQYYVEVISVTTEFGRISESLPAIAGVQNMPLIDLGISDQSCYTQFNSNPSGNCWRYDALALFLTLFVMGLFSAYALPVGGIVSALFLGMMSAWGWTPNIPGVFIGLLILLSIVYALGNRRIAR